MLLEYKSIKLYWKEEVGGFWQTTFSLNININIAPK